MLNEEEREFVERLANDIMGKPPRYRCHCKFETNSRFRWWLHRVRSWPFK